MTCYEETVDGNIQFSWGRKGAQGTKKGVQLYQSFIYNNIEYCLYDCVYLFEDNVSEPYIGKIVKMWEAPANKKLAKILWFFRPEEMQKHLGNVVPLEKEIFLAAGEGEGLFNINSLYAVAGKCSVVCTSKDRRNPQPSQEELKNADWIFYRAFNVGSYTISDKIEDVIAGVEVRCIFNRKEQKLSTIFKSKVDDNEGCLISDRSIEESPIKPSLTKMIGLKVFSKGGVSSLHATNVLDSHSEGKYKSGEVRAHSSSSSDRSSMKMGASDKGKSFVAVNEAKIPVSQNSISFHRKVSSDVIKTSKHQYNSQIFNDSRMIEKGSKTVNLNENQRKLSDGSLKRKLPALSNDTAIIADGATVKICKRPKFDMSNCFQEIPWDAELINACNQGRLVLLQNLDPDYSKGEIKDLIYDAFEKNCRVRLIEQSTFTNPNNGQALVIFKSPDVADIVARELNEKILMLPNERPLIATKGIVRSPEKMSAALFGHLSIGKFTTLRRFREAKRKAVSTSHYSQPNTIEYEMAVEWMLLDTQTKGFWKDLCEEQHREVQQLVKNLKYAPTSSKAIYQGYEE